MQNLELIHLYNVLKSVDQLLAANLEKFELTPRLWWLLNLIKNNYQTIQELQSQVQTNKSTLSRQLMQLEQKGLVEYVIGSERHQRHYHLTTLGLQVQNKTFVGLKQLDAQIFRHWSTEEQQFFNVLLSRFETNLAEM